MSEFAVAALRIAFLAAIWMFILLAAGVIRTDIFGERADAQPRRGLRSAARARPFHPSLPPVALSIDPPIPPAARSVARRPFPAAPRGPS